MNIKETVDAFETKYPNGYTDADVKSLLKEHFPDVPIEKYRESLGVITGELIGKDFITYHDDVALGIRLVVEDREMTSFEFD